MEDGSLGMEDNLRDWKRIQQRLEEDSQNWKMTSGSKRGLLGLEEEFRKFW
jgi:hypothetical protein